MFVGHKADIPSNEVGIRAIINYSWHVVRISIPVKTSDKGKIGWIFHGHHMECIKDR